MTLHNGKSLLEELKSIIPFQNMGLVGSRIPNTLTFLDSGRFLSELAENPNIIGVITNHSFCEKVIERRADVTTHLAEEPKYCFYSVYNERATQINSNLKKTIIHPSARIHDRAYVAPNGVTIGPGVVIEPMVTVMPGVRIGGYSIIRAGSSLGVEGFEHKRLTGGLLSVIHDQFCDIGEYVEIGANNTVARGLMGEDTRVGDYTKTDCLVHIAHCAQIGKRCIIPAAAMIAGSTVIGDDVWIGPNASISSQVRIGNGAFVTLGSVVVRDVPENGHVTGNFAIAHREFISNMRNLGKLNQSMSKNQDHSDS